MTIEQDIAERLSRGDSLAEKLLYETYASWLLGVCFRYVCDRSVAEDLLHDGFIQILTHIRQFRWQGEGSLKAWLFKVQQNTILMHLRKESQLIETLPIDEVQVGEIPDPETIRDIPHQVLLQLIAELPPGYRAVFNMYVIDGHSHKEIAQLLGIQEKSSSSQLLHAKRLLAARIKAWRKENL